VGNKALKLSYLLRQGLPVPATWVCTQDAYRRYASGDTAVLERVRDELQRTLDPSRRCAVRSSANLEDGDEATFAGQFVTMLDVQGVDGVADAIRVVWDIVGSPGVLAYLEANGIDDRSVKMGVIVQEMIPSVAAGVSFSVNPVTGMDEVLVEAVCGSGEMLVQKGITPQRWVYKWGAWI
jgi:pyruvate,water dikinase